MEQHHNIPIRKAVNNAPNEMVSIDYPSLLPLHPSSSYTRLHSLAKRLFIHQGYSSQTWHLTHQMMKRASYTRNRVRIHLTVPSLRVNRTDSGTVSPLKDTPIIKIAKRSTSYMADLIELSEDGMEAFPPPTSSGSADKPNKASGMFITNCATSDCNLGSNKVQRSPQNLSHSLQRRIPPTQRA